MKQAPDEVGEGVGDGVDAGRRLDKVSRRVAVDSVETNWVNSSIKVFLATVKTAEGGEGDGDGDKRNEGKLSAVDVLNFTSPSLFFLVIEVGGQAEQSSSMVEGAGEGKEVGVG